MKHITYSLMGDTTDLKDILELDDSLESIDSITSVFINENIFLDTVNSLTGSDIKKLTLVRSNPTRGYAYTIPIAYQNIRLYKMSASHMGTYAKDVDYLYESVARKLMYVSEYVSFYKDQEPYKIIQYLRDYQKLYGNVKKEYYTFILSKIMKHLKESYETFRMCCFLLKKYEVREYKPYQKVLQDKMIRTLRKEDSNGI